MPKALARIKFVCEPENDGSRFCSLISVNLSNGELMTALTFNAFFKKDLLMLHE